MMKSVVSLFPKPQEDPQNVKISALSIRGFSLSRAKRTNKKSIPQNERINAMSTKRAHLFDF